MDFDTFVLVRVCVCLCVRLVRALKCNKRGSKLTPAAARPGSRLRASLLQSLLCSSCRRLLTRDQSSARRTHDAANLVILPTYTHKHIHTHTYICNLHTYLNLCVCVRLHSINVVSKTKSAAACGKWHVVACHMAPIRILNLSACGSA